MCPAPHRFIRPVRAQGPQNEGNALGTRGREKKEEEGKKEGKKKKTLHC